MSSEANVNELLLDFVDEAAGSLRALPEQLERFGRDRSDEGAINAVFRAVHSIKGNAGFFGLATIKNFSHSLENTLDEVRKGKCVLTPELQRSVILAVDSLEEMLQASLEGPEPPLSAENSALLEKIGELAKQGQCAASPEEELVGELLALAEELAGAEAVHPAEWAERIRELVQHTQAQAAAAPQPAAASDGPESLRGSVFVCGGEDVSQRVAGLLELFETFAQGGYGDAAAERFLAAAEAFAGWALGQGNASLAAALRKAAHELRTIHNSPLDVDAVLLSVIWDSLRPELLPLRQATAEPPTASAAAGSSASAPAGAAPAAGRSETAEPGKARLVRVKEERLEEFLEHVSSLFITGELLKDVQSRLAQERTAASLAEELRQINLSFTKQSRELQRGLVELRQVPVSGLLSKFPRLARTLATQLGKEVDVHLVGEDTEVDKTLVEDLDSPLTHMVRNVVDHGIEPPAERKARGVSPIGNLWLKVERTRTHVRVIVQDDGRGIDPARLRRKVVEKGLISAEEAAALNDEQAVQLIFRPGFSTAEKLTEVSGRGVGLDVVRTTIREHNGDVQVQSKLGEGTTFVLEIPLREAVVVIDGLLLQHAGQRFVVPFEHIREITELHPSDLKPVQGARVARVREGLFDAVSLSDILSLPRRSVGPNDRHQGVLVGGKFGDLCLLADEVLGHRQVVVNSLNEILPGNDAIAGVAQLGGGRLALVLSVPDIVKRQASPPRVDREAAPTAALSS